MGLREIKNKHKYVAYTRVRMYTSSVKHALVVLIHYTASAALGLPGEKVFSITRDGVSFVDDVSHNSPKMCGAPVKPEARPDMTPI